MKYTIDKFANEIRKKYPKDYDDLSNSKLVELWLKKYPEDKIKVDLKQKKSPPRGSVNSNIQKSRKAKTTTTISAQETHRHRSLPFLNFLGNTFLFMVGVWIMATLFNKIHRVELVDNFNRKLENTWRKKKKETDKMMAKLDDIKNTITNTDTLQTPSETTQLNPEPHEIHITSEARSLVNNSVLLKALNTSSDQKTILMEILSDPDSDPQYKEGNACDNYTTRCKFCNNYIHGKWNTLKSIVRDNFTCSGLLMMGTPCLGAEIILKSKEKREKSDSDTSGDWGVLFNEVMAKKAYDMKPTIETACKLYKTGTKYACIDAGFGTEQEFCSKKCESEYHYLNN